MDRDVAGFGCHGEEPHRLQSILADDRALDIEHAQTVYGVEVALVGGDLEQAYGLLRVLARAASFEKRVGESRHGLQVAGGRAFAVPAHGLVLVAGHADAGRVHPAQAIHDVSVAAVAQPAQRLQEIAVIGGDAPHVQRYLIAGCRRRHPLAQVVHAVDGSAVVGDDDVAEARSGQGGGACDGRLHNQRAVGVEEPQREGQRQLDRVHLDAEPTLLAVGREAADLHRQLDDASERLGRPDRRRRRRRGCHRLWCWRRGRGRLWGNRDDGPLPARRGRRRRHANDVYAGAGNSRDRCGWALGSCCRREGLCRPGAVGRDGREHHDHANDATDGLPAPRSSHC